MNLDGSSTRFEEGIQVWSELASLTVGKTLEEVAYLCVLAHRELQVKTKLSQYQNLWALLKREGAKLEMKDPDAAANWKARQKRGGRGAGRGAGR